MTLHNLENLTWYGSINLLSFGASQENVMRLVSGSSARVLLSSKEESK